MHIQSLTCQSQGFSLPAPLRDGVTREKKTPLPPRAVGVSVPGGDPTLPPHALEAQDGSGSTHELELLPVRETLNDKPQPLFN